jgi:iron(III) transport system substrate-binding protein
MGTLIVPNAVVLIEGGPNPSAARRFIDYLLQPETERALAESEAAQMPVRPGIEIPDHVRPLESITAMQVDYVQLAERLDQLSGAFLKDWVDANN